jgi:membrane fusion protein
MERTPLFRADAVAAHRRAELGRVVIVSPMTLRVLGAAFVALAAAMAALSYFGTYTAHRTLQGRLVTERRSIDVRSPQLGTVLEKRVTEGQIVERGDTLYVISSERTSSARGATQQAVGDQLDSRRRSLLEQIVNTRALARMEREATAESIAMLAAEARELDDAAAGQADRSELARGIAERYERVRAMGFVSEEQLLGKRADLLEQRGRLHSLTRERSTVARQLADLSGQVAAAAVRYDNQVAELERAVAETELQIAENEARRAISVAAPDAGVVTGVRADVGEPVDSSTPLAFIVPIASDLRAELYAPSRAVGFLAVGQDVQLRYESYPYQKFGHYRGRVAAISRTALAPPATASAASGRGEPMYEVVVALERQTVTAYGEARPLRSGMAVEADVLLETRRLYEWVFEPLYSLAGERRPANQSAGQ